MNRGRNERLSTVRALRINIISAAVFIFCSSDFLLKGLVICVADKRTIAQLKSLFFLLFDGY